MTMNEENLIIDAQQGDLQAFNRLVLAYQDQVFNVAYRILSDASAAEDASQNTFLTAFRKLNTFRGGSFKSWILTIVTHACYDELRLLKRRPTTPLEPVMPDTDEEFDSPAWLASDDPSPEENSMLNDLEQAIQHCLDDLPEDFRTVVVLVDVEGLDYQSVSEVAHKPIGTIKSRLARARLKMRDCLQGFGELIPDQFRLDREAA